MIKDLRNSGKKACVIFLIILITAGLQGYSQEVRKLSNFDEISFNISGNLYLTQADKYSVKLEGNANDLEKIITKVDGNTLVIKTEGFKSISGNVTIYISMPKLTELSLAGSGDVVADKTFKCDNIELSITGSGDIVFKDLQANSAEISITGSGDADVSGKVKEKLEINITGSGDVDALSLEAQNVEVEIAGSGSSKVFATNKLETEIVGSGSVRYKGDPLVDANSVGSGSTRRID